MIYFHYMEPNGQEIEDLTDAPNLKDLMQKPDAVTTTKKKSSTLVLVVMLLVVVIAAAAAFAVYSGLI
jgi:uncharacterized protein HemX